MLFRFFSVPHETADQISVDLLAPLTPFAAHILCLFLVRHCEGEGEEPGTSLVDLAVHSEVLPGHCAGAGIGRGIIIGGDADLVPDGDPVFLQELVHLVGDLLRQALSEKDIREILPEAQCLTVCAKEPESLKAITEYLAQYAEVSDRLALTQPRHLDAARRAAGCLKDALATLDSFTPDMAATDLQAAQAALSEITGDSADEKLLDRVFSQFCVGK